MKRQLDLRNKTDSKTNMSFNESFYARVLLNKSDKLSKNKDNHEKLKALEVLKDLSTESVVISTSATKKDGVKELIETMVELINK